MNMKIARRLLAVTMAASLVVMPLTVGATDAGGSSSSETSVTTEEAAEVVTETQVALGGEVVKNDLPGAFALKTNPAFVGFAAKVSKEQAKAAAGLGANQTPFMRVYTIDRKKSNLAFQSFDAAAALVGGTVLGGINLDYGALTGGKFTELPEGVELPVSMGIKNFDPNTKYDVVEASTGGKTRILESSVSSKGVISFTANGGLNAYGLIGSKK